MCVSMPAFVCKSVYALAHVPRVSACTLVAVTALPLGLLLTSLPTYLVLPWSQCLRIRFNQALCGLHILERKVETEVVGGDLWPPLPS